MTTGLSHHQKYLMEEFAEDYRHHRLPRRDLLKRVLSLTGSVPMTATMLFALGCGDSSSDAPAPSGTAAPTAIPLVTTEAGVGPNVSPSDPAIVAADITFKGPASDIKAYLARPAATGSFPTVLVIHENQGLIDHLKDVARRFAKEGFVALSIDLLSRGGGTTADMAAVMAIYRGLVQDDMTADMKASIDYLKTQTFVKANAIGVIGFCFGGGEAFEITIASPDVKAAVPFYGSVREQILEPLGRTQAAIFAVYGELDRGTAQSPIVEERLKASGKPYQIKVYQGAPHAFFNENRTNSYNQAAATASWKDTLAWFRTHLKG